MILLGEYHCLRIELSYKNNVKKNNYTVGLFWKTYIHFIFLPRMKGETPLPTSLSLPIEFADF